MPLLMFLAVCPGGSSVLRERPQPCLCVSSCPLVITLSVSRAATRLTLPAPTQPPPTYQPRTLLHTHSIMASNRIEADGAAGPALQTVASSTLTSSPNWTCLTPQSSGAAGRPGGGLVANGEALLDSAASGANDDMAGVQVPSELSLVEGLI
ncbi:unnamed protein product [Pleuronectes platessa]|uniref:Uncharacterized protein n=1 Tax=Pleuronectes platessa TaxID=8262 RepID=A0A9N7UPH0_PLEPL|nr:unnamed protein product [Pleuronectes platessa]